MRPTAPEHFDTIVAHKNANPGMTAEQAAAALGFDLGTNTANATDDPWAKFVKTDTRIPLERIAAILQREDGLSELKALQVAMKMDGDVAKPLLDAEDKRFAEQATAGAKAEWANTPEGIETLGKLRTAQANALKERADNMRPELASRGLPVDTMSDTEVVGYIEDMAAQRAAAVEANSLDANLHRIAELDAERNGGADE